MYNTQHKIKKLFLLLTDPDEARKRNYKQRTECHYPTEKNKQLIESYYQELVIQKFKDTTILQKLSILKFLLQHYQKDFDTLTKKDVKTLLFKIEMEKTLKGEDRSDISKAIMKQQLKDFLRFLHDENVITEPLFESIHVKIPNTPVTSEDLYTEDEVNAMIDKAMNIRDKAFIAILYDTGGRIGEILPMKLKDIEDSTNIIRITISGKTGTRTMLLDFSIYYVRQWLNAHPYRDDPNACVWCHIKDRGDKGYVGYITMLKNLQNIARKAGIKKRVYNHGFRHSSVTRDAQNFSEALNKVKHGWTSNSTMLTRYSHLNSANLERAQLEKMGLETSKINRKLNRCPNCDEVNPHDFDRCGRCGYALTLDGKSETSNVKDMLATLMQDPEFVRIFQQKLMSASV